MVKNYNALRNKIVLNKKIKIVSCASVGGELEKHGPLGEKIDIYCKNDLQDEKTWEQAESEMARLALSKALEKANLTENNIDILLAGDLMNQCTGSGYGLENFDIPYLGLYGACSTMAEGIMIACLMIDSGHINTAAVVASSHFCSAERQFRFPLEYGSFAGTCAQTTVTGAGGFILSSCDENTDGIFVTEVLPGIVCDAGIRDAGNMGAAMATAAADTIIRYFENTDTGEIDFLATGDLGKEGHSIVADFIYEKGIDLKAKYKDCGMLIYNTENQDVGCGGSGCGCSAVVTASYIYDSLINGEINNAIVIGTGAMMSPQSLLQGLSIPAVAHLIKLEKK